MNKTFFLRAATALALLVSCSLFGADTVPLTLRMFSGTNVAYDTSRLFVTSSVPALNGMYTQLWGGVSMGTGVWKQVKSTNLIWLRDPGANHAGEEWTLEPTTNSPDYFFFLNPEQPPLNLPNGVWSGAGLNPPWNGSITVGVLYGTNTAHRTNRIFYRAATAAPAVDGYTNILHVEIWGDDRLASRTNGWPYRTLYAANLASRWGDVVQIGPGYFECRSFYSHQGVTWRGSGQGSTMCSLHSTNTTSDTNPNPYFPGAFSSSGFVLNSNVTLCHLTLTNCSIIGSDNTILNPHADCVNVYLHDLTVIHPRVTPLFSTDATLYLYVGIRLKSVSNTRLERVTIISANAGIEIIGSKLSTNTFVDIKSCKVICDRELEPSAESRHPLQALILSDRPSRTGMQVNISDSWLETRKGTNNANAVLNFDTLNPNWRLHLSGVTLSAGSNSVPIRDNSHGVVQIAGTWTETRKPDDYAIGTNTTVANGLRFRTSTAEPALSELDWMNGGTNGAMFWKSNGIVWLTTATNGTVVSTRVGP